MKFTSEDRYHIQLWDDFLHIWKDLGVCYNCKDFAYNHRDFFQRVNPSCVYRVDKRKAQEFYM